MKKRTAVAMTAAGLAAVATAHAQSSVTLYGIVDNGIAYQSSSTSLGSTTGGRSAVKMSTGVWAGSRFGLKGSEDLGGGSKAIFQLESGFSTANGTSQFAGGIFTRQAWVGLTNPTYGTLTAGRQYTAYYTLLSPYSPTTWLTGYFGAHPGDIDSLDTSYRTNNSLVYMSPKFYGFTFGGSYAFGGQPGSVNAGSTWSAGIQYMNGPLGIAAAFQRVNNSTSGGGDWGANSTTSNGGAQTAVSAINNGYKTAQAQQRVAVTAGYQFSSAWDISVSYSNVQYIPGVNSAFRNTAIFNTAGAVLHFKPSAQWDFAGGYAYTRATQSNGITSAAQYHQFTLSQYYSLSKRTGLYAVEAYQRANGKTLAGGKIIDATASIGDGFNTSPSSSRSQVGVGVGLIHRF
ncbi:porin [Burkholderia thailandensis]|uniref:Gram-negative porin family protein n=2 Tax=Burkholderia thailandensis TaxID=57975 RepID=A0AAW9CST5_BURTH|nr:porin [Burkholderia thailandensis]ABC36115.1 outer membrane porin OpcP [Burkholderia thailandensis E264]AHI67380.1 gram-negative porin family protein [Burkholderia thailandensis H0587]AHI77088.1 gram-negative porin family protein [Burkholderia thailandensis 2002721723]AHI81247.1 gram-negative porin family protein [Burkholderia thailandensis E444]AIC90787.1 gram-negative porin family protein [Burkholderia thailandensis USAMRU Malaysia \